MAIFTGIAVYTHFICKANFCNAKKTPIEIILLTCLPVVGSVAIVFNAVTDNILGLLISMVFTLITWFLLDFSLWARGYPVSEFFDRQNTKIKEPNG